MNKPDVKKLILLNLPYVFAFYFADKIAAVFRLASGTEFIDKLTNGFAVFGTAFANPLPSFHPVDLLVGLVAGVLLKLAVYVKGKNRKKFRQGEEYGSARWGKPEDIKPYLAYTDSHPEARGGFALTTDAVRVECPAQLLDKLPEERRQTLLNVLAQDPRPGYQHEPGRVYGFPFAGFEVKFTVEGDLLTVLQIESR